MPRARFSTGWGIRRDRKAQRGSGAGGGSSNDPAGILGGLLHADFDVADPGVVLNVGNVASIPNRGGDSAAMVQATAANQPAFSATSFAGGPGMTFDGVNDTMLCTFTTPIPTGRRPMFWAVFKQHSTTVVDQIVAALHGPLGVGLPYLVMWGSRSTGASFTGGADCTAGGGAAGAAALGPTETANTHLAEIADQPNGVGAFALDGVLSNSSNGAAACIPIAGPMPQVRAGAFGVTASQFCACTVRRIIVANDLPSAAQIAAMRAYLRAQPYGLTF